MSANKIYTTTYYATRGISYHTAAGLGYEQLVIFHNHDINDYTVLERNNNTGYCKDVLTGKRISAKVYEEQRKATVYAF